MGHASRELAKYLHLLSLAQLGLNLFPLCKVRVEGNKTTLRQRARAELYDSTILETAFKSLSGLLALHA